MLTHKQQLFVLEYQRTLNGTQSAISAGYSARSAGSIANELLKKPEIQQALKHGHEERTDRLIADVTQIQTFWTETMNDIDIDIKHRLRASELLAKSLGAFVERSQVDIHEVKTLADLMLEAYQECL